MRAVGSAALQKRDGFGDEESFSSLSISPLKASTNLVGLRGHVSSIDGSEDGL